MRQHLLFSPDDWSAVARRAAIIATLGHWWGNDPEQCIYSVHGYLAVKYGAQLYRHPHGTMELVVGTGSEAITARVLRAVTFGLGYGSPMAYITACMERRREVEARLALRASSLWAA